MLNAIKSRDLRIEGELGSWVFNLLLAVSININLVVKAFMAKKKKSQNNSPENCQWFVCFPLSNSHIIIRDRKDQAGRKKMEFMCKFSENVSI